MNIMRLLFILLSVVTIVLAREKYVEFENISTMSGLSAPQAKCVFQDSEGYLWIGTMSGGGLNLYDGYSFTVFKNDREDSTSIIHNNIFNIAEDSRGDIWIAAGGGISKYVKSEDRFYNYYLERYFKDIEDLSYHAVFEVFVDSRDRIWFGTSYHGIVLFNHEENSFQAIPNQSKDSVLALPQVCGDIREDKNGTIWASGGESGLLWFDENKKVFSQVVLTQEEMENFKLSRIFRICPDSQMNVWIMTANDLYKYDNSEQKLIHLLNYFSPDRIGYRAHEGELFEDSSGNMYALQINMKQPIIFPNLQNDYIKINSPELSATDILIDSFGILWITDFENGLYKSEPYKQSFYTVSYNSRNGLALEKRQINAVSSSFKNSDLIYIFSRDRNNGFLNSLNVKTGELKDYSIKFKDIIELFPNSDGTIWMGHWESGLSKWNPDTGQLDHFFVDSSRTPNLFNTLVGSLQKDSEGNLWIGAGNGIYRFSQISDKLELIIPEYDVVTMNLDQESLWIGTYGSGLIRYNLITKKIEKFQYDKYSSSISSNTITDLYRDDEGFLWIGTMEGLNRLDLRSNILEVFRSSDGLIDNRVVGIMADDYGNIWLATRGGISKIMKDSKYGISFSNYDSNDGLLNTEFKWNCKIKDDFGRIYFGSQKGLHFFTPHKRTSSPPITKVTELMINGRPYEKYNTQLYDQLNSSEMEVDLNYEQNTIRFDFLALHFAQPVKNKYSYYLEGYESDWLYTGNQSAQYVNLEPGKYTFHLRSANREGIWSTQEIKIPVIINEPWWNTWYSYILFIGLVIGGASGIRQYELKRRKENENKKLLEAENRRKTQELEEARKLQLSMLPRELPQLPDLDIAVYMKTATEVGGDYYDFHVGLDGTFTAVIGDATGHGMKAGTMVTSSKNLFSSYAENDDIINTFHEMTRCIKNMHLDNLSMCLSMIKIKSNILRMSSAGMPPIYIYRKSTSSVEEYLFQGMPLGTMRRFPYEEKETALSSGDAILLMSDGFPELVNSDNEMFGFKRTKHLFEECGLDSPEEIISKLKVTGSEWLDDKDPDDDVTFVVIKIR